MAKKINIAVIFGGRSGEHEVSLMSARSVLSVLDPEKYEVTQIGITHEGKWLTGKNTLNAFAANKTSKLTTVLIKPEPGDNCLYSLKDGQLTNQPAWTLLFLSCTDHLEKMARCKVCLKWQI